MDTDKVDSKIIWHSQLIINVNLYDMFCTDMYFCLQDGVISEDEFVLAFLRNELLTTNVVNKIMTRFASAKTCILED